MEMDTIWNVGLTAALAVAGFLGRSIFTELQRLQVLVNKTREEIAKEYLTKQEAAHDLNRIMDRLEALDAKLDRIIERR